MAGQMLASISISTLKGWLHLLLIDKNGKEMDIELSV
jgi:hypothetical protein